MKAYRLAKKDGTVQNLPLEIQTNRDAIRWVAKQMGIRLKKNVKLDEDKFEAYFYTHKGLVILCDDIGFFPRGTNLTAADLKSRAAKAQGPDKRKVFQEVKRHEDRGFVQSTAFCLAGVHA